MTLGQYLALAALLIILHVLGGIVLWIVTAFMDAIEDMLR